MTSPKYGVFIDERATYASLDGDSGAPIFSPPNGSNQVQFYGIAVSAWT